MSGILWHWSFIGALTIRLALHRCDRDKDTFLDKWGDVCASPSKLIEAIREKYVEEGKIKTRTSKNGNYQERTG